MKKLGVIFLILLFGIHLISAVSVEMKSNYSQGETIIAKVSGNFYTAIKNENVFLYRKDAQIRVPMEFYSKKIGGDYYIYGQLLGKSPDNYSIIISDVKYATVLGKTSTEDIKQDFTVTKYLADFSIEPGFIEKTKGNFTIKIKNLRDTKLTVNSVSQIVPETEKNESESGGLFASLFKEDKEENNNSENKLISLSLIPGEEKEMKFSMILLNNELKTVILKSDNTIYEIPVYILATKIPEPVLEPKYFRFEDNIIRFYISPNETKTEKVILNNKAGENLTEIILAVSNDIQKIVSVSPNKIELMENNETREIEIIIRMNNESFDNFMKNISESNITYMGKIEAISNENFSAELDLEIIFTKGNITYVEKPKPKKCAELGGKICDKSKEQCSGNTTYAEDVCCLGTCVEKEKSNFGKYIGWIILFFIILFLIWFFLKKYRGDRGEINLLNVAKGKR